VTEPATERFPRFVFQPQGGRVDGVLHQPMHSALRPHTHRMEHEVGNVGLLSLVHHVVMLVHMENVCWRDVVCPPALPPSGKGVIVTFHNHGHRTGSPAEQMFQTRAWVSYLVEVVEIDIKDGIHRFSSAAERWR